MKKRIKMKMEKKRIIQVIIMIFILILKEINLIIVGKVMVSHMKEIEKGKDQEKRIDLGIEIEKEKDLKIE